MKSDKMVFKLCLVTGANSGIGRATAYQLAAMGAYVIMLCRNPDKGEKAQKEIIKSTGNTGVELLVADLASTYDIRKVAGELRERFDRLDLLINNAGIYPGRRTETAEGVEQTLATNHFGPFLLTNLLIEMLHASEWARVVTVASGAHRAAAGFFDPDNLQLRKGYTSWRAYALSKLCNIMFTHELAKRSADTPITANAMHPGMVSTRLTKDSGLLAKFLFNVGKPFMKSSRAGADTAVYLSASEEVSGITGKYFQDREVTAPAPIAFNDKQTERLWEISAELTGLEMAR